MLAAVTLTARAQFTPSGNGPASSRWNCVRTDAYELIYPQGLDSLAREYATLLEQVRMAVGTTAGMTPGQWGRGHFPVILHTRNTLSNGMVSWTPRRMELITTPDASAPLPIPWMEQLAVHESRHLAQMQYLLAPKFWADRLLLGELAGGAMSALWCGPQFFEGDAVVAETELSRSGRGRNADFLQYYRACFAQGDMRNYWRWRYGSLRHWTPDYYTVGYISIAGLRSVWNDPTVVQRYYSNLLNGRGTPVNVWEKTIREVTGQKWSQAWTTICDTLKQQWDREMDSRAPFMPTTRVSAPQRRYVSLSSPVMAGGRLYCVRSGMYESASLVEVLPSGNTRTISRWAMGSSDIKSSPDGRLWWSEHVSDLRWTDRSSSDIWWCGPDSRHHRLTRGKRLFNPAPSPDGSVLAAVCYLENGLSSVLLLSPEDGSILGEHPAPAGMQPVELEWDGDTLYASAITDKGLGIYRVDGWNTVLESGPWGIKGLRRGNGNMEHCILLTSDRSGVNELYRLDCRDGSLTQLSSSPVGASGYVFNDAADTLYYCVTSPEGVALHSTAAADLMARKWERGRTDAWAFADSLTSQYMALGTASTPGTLIDRYKKVTVSDPQKYGRLRHLVNIHSWAPVYVDYDSIADLSMESLTSTAGLGATVFFQNMLGTLDGSVAYKAAPDDDRWFHSVHAKWTYTGLYPVIEGSLSYGSRYSQHYENTQIEYAGKQSKGLSAEQTDNLLWTAGIKAYIPFNLSSGGWLRGIVPQVTFNIASDRMSHGGRKYSVDIKDTSKPLTDDNITVTGDEHFGEMSYSLLTRMNTSLRAYCMLPAAASCLYPKLGIGAEVGLNLRPWVLSYDFRKGALSELFTPNRYVSIYGYLPGLGPSQGLRISAIMQHGYYGIFGEGYVSTSPRGMTLNNLMSELGYNDQVRLSLDYAIPFAPVDWSFLCPVAYIRNFELIPHLDLANFRLGNDTIYKGLPTSGNLVSAGAELNVCLGNLAWVPYTTRIGISWSYNTGHLAGIISSVQQIERNHFGLVFSVDL